ncbi:KxYKxGKxW signal peptide domain-containing protein, partial [Leuconostoc gelidum subsp. gasicomitatum]|uniref:KxYKxGKxW signal peptide domain-containing protein n=1 Tax=Leuconostoc gasicomitatum TaxID=115778 RepID=UPI001CC77FC0
MKPINLFRSKEAKTRFKMYKSGKQWLVSGLTLVGGLLGTQLVDGSVSADSTTADNAGTTKENTSDTLVTKSTAVIPADKTVENTTASTTDKSVENSTTGTTDSTLKTVDTQSVSNSQSLSVSLSTSDSSSTSNSMSMSDSLSSSVVNSESLKESTSISTSATSKDGSSSVVATHDSSANSSNSTTAKQSANVSSSATALTSKTGTLVAGTSAFSATNSTVQAPSIVTSQQLTELENKLPENSKVVLDAKANELNIMLPRTALITSSVSTLVKNFADQNALVANFATLKGEKLTATENQLDVQTHPDSNRAGFSESVSTHDQTSTSPTSVTVAVPDQITNDAKYYQQAKAAGTAQDVANFAQLQAAWTNSAINYINITSDFNATTGNLGNRANGASVIINGNNHTIDLRNQTFTYSSASTATTFTISNATIKEGFSVNDGNGYSLISAAPASQLTANINNITLTKSDANGYNPIHVMYGIGSKINFSGTNVFNLSNEVTRSVGSVNFANNSSVTLNRTSNDIAFSEFYFETQALTGSVGYGNTLIMGDGSSNAAYTYNGQSANFPAVYLNIDGITAGDNVNWTQTGFQYFINGTQGSTSNAKFTFGQNFNLNAPVTTQPGAIRLQGTQQAVFNAGTEMNIHQRDNGGIFQVAGTSSITFISPKALYLNTENNSGASVNSTNGIFTGTGTITMNNSSISTWSNPNNSTSKPAGDANAVFVNMKYVNGTTTLTDVSGNSAPSSIITRSTREMTTKAIANGKINVNYVDAKGHIVKTVAFDVSDKSKYNIGQTIDLATTPWAVTNMPANYMWALADQIYPGAVTDAQSGGDATSINDNGDSYGQANYAIVPIDGDTYSYNVYVYGTPEQVQYQYKDQAGNVVKADTIDTAGQEYTNGLPTANFGNVIDWTNNYYTRTNVPSGYKYDTSHAQPATTTVSTDNSPTIIYVTASVQQVDVTIKNTDGTLINGSSSITVTVNGTSGVTKTLADLLQEAGVSEAGYHLNPSDAAQTFKFDTTNNGDSATDNAKQTQVINLTPDYQQAAIISTNQPAVNPATNVAYPQIPTSASDAAGTSYNDDGVSNGNISFSTSDADLVRQGFIYTVLGPNGNTYPTLAAALVAFKKFDTTTNGSASTDNTPQLYTVNYSPDPASQSTSTSTSTSDSASASTSTSVSDSASISTSTSTSTSTSGSTSASDSGSYSASTSASDSASSSTSTSVSDSASISTSTSDSASASTSTSVSDSASTSTSSSNDSGSASDSTSASDSVSISTSTSVSDSASISTSTSDSASASTST